jgi:hypothetical protein
MADHSKLEVQQEGLDVLRQVKGSVCPVVVIGPYRSGKSFTLNQLMGVGCGECCGRAGRQMLAGRAGTASPAAPRCSHQVAGLHARTIMTCSLLLSASASIALCR